MRKNSFSKDDIVLIRCMITGESEDYYRGKDYQGNRYLIVKNQFFKHLAVGDDRTFYAYKKEDMRLFSGKAALYPITHEEYLELLGEERSAGKTLKELGVNLRNL
ncbi:hypothetical protein ACPWSR_02695 [Alloiococcus sp. CFN-8]|uniref:hypothetical protein n=1 Tax=Alloiococcus sp. CFN-8 TaxID=3416081 RepID=UPI003CF5BB89